MPVSAIPTTNETLSKESISPYFPLKRRKKRRKSSSSSGKWPRNANTADNENRTIDGSDNSRSANYEHKDEDNTEHGDDTGKKYLAFYIAMYFVIIVFVKFIENIYLNSHFVFNIHLE